MFLTTEASVRWRRLAWLATFALIVSYGVYSWRSDFTHGGSWMGQFYGYLAAGLIALLIYYSVRKRSYKSKLGSLENWAQSHAYLGLLVVLVVFLHTGFRFQDRLAVSAFIVMGVVSLSGLVGVIFYTSLPRVLTAVGTEPSSQALAQDLEQSRLRMERLGRDRSPAFLEVLRQLDQMERPMAFAGWRVLGRHGLPKRDDRKLKQLLGSVPAQEQAELKRLLVQARQIGELHRQLAAQQRYRNLLKVWLYVHIPMTVALVVLVVAHIFVAYYFT